MMKHRLGNVASLGIVCGLIILCAAVHGTRAQAPPAPVATRPAEVSFECRWADAPIEIDGKADEAVWATAQPIEDFRRAWEGAKERPPKSTTKAKLLWDREYLYFFAEMQDTDLRAKVKEHDAEVWEDDAFELFFKPAKDKPGYYECNFNPLNTIMDCFWPKRDLDNWKTHRSEGEFNIESAIVLHGTLNKFDDKDAGWAIEGRIPWKSFLRTGGRPEPGEVWTCAPCRVDTSKDLEGYELSSAAILKSKPFADYHIYEDYAPLKFVGPGERGDAQDAKSAKPRTAFGIEKLAPLTTSTVVGSPDPPKLYRVVNAYPKLNVRFPVCVAHQPGSDRIWIIGEESPWGRTKLMRFVDEPNVDTCETLTPVDGIAYSIVFHPDFLENGFVFVGRNGPQGAPMRKAQIVRYKVDPKPPYTFDPKSETVIIEWESIGHDGCAMAFAPDGTMFVTTGDGTSDSDTWLTGQDLSRLQAKVLRIDVEHPDPDKHYSVPKDNPFVGQKDVRPETWAYGMRNPWRMALDAKTGNLWIGQNGQDQWEAVYLIEKGANYGWSLVEGSYTFYPNRKQGPHPIAKPIAEHPHSEARSLTGGFVYDGSDLPKLVGAYLYGDYSTGKIWAMRVDNQRKITYHEEIADTTAQITSFALDSRRNLLITDSGGHRVCRLEPVPAGTARTDFPRMLSASGLFKDVQRHVMADGIIPYSVNAELWSDGAYKERFIAIPHKEAKDSQPGEDRRIGYTNNRGWEFPNETVIVKSFALEREAGNPQSRKWIETRFFTRQEGEWVGYSYVWNDEQTDATLVDAAGMDRDYEFRDPNAEGGIRKQKWHYPSRTECMVCHSRAANFVLGLQTLQMNKDHDYAALGGPVDNQLRVLEHLGMVRVNYSSGATESIQADAAKKGLASEAAAAYVKRHSPQESQREPHAASFLLPTPPSRQPKLVNPHDTSADPNSRARAYLHANCANCHVEAGGGNAMMEMEFTKPAKEMNLFDADPLHERFNIEGAKLIASGSPERSVLLHRMALRTIEGKPGQMPPLATNVRDEAAIKLLQEWIAQLPKSEN